MIQFFSKPIVHNEQIKKYINRFIPWRNLYVLNILGNNDSLAKSKASLLNCYIKYFVFVSTMSSIHTYRVFSSHFVTGTAEDADFINVVRL